MKKEMIKNFYVNIPAILLVTSLLAPNLGFKKEEDNRILCYPASNYTKIDIPYIDEQVVLKEEKRLTSYDATIDVLIDEEKRKVLLARNMEKQGLYIYKEEKVYSGMNIDNEYEDYLYDKCKEYAINRYDNEEMTELLFQIVMTLGEKESNGTWACDGVISATNDYGQFQINKCNHKMIYENLGFTSDELLNDRYKNGEAAIHIVCIIIDNKKCKSLDDVFGMYNGWTNWNNISRSVKYKDACLKIMDNYFKEDKVKELVK